MIQAFETGNIQVATQIHLKLFPLFKALFATTNPIPVKTALKLKGWDVGSTRLPLWEEQDWIRQKLEAVLTALSVP